MMCAGGLLVQRHSVGTEFVCEDVEKQGKGMGGVGVAGLAPSNAKGLWEPSLWDGVLQAVRADRSSSAEG